MYRCQKSSKLAKATPIFIPVSGPGQSPRMVREGCIRKLRNQNPCMQQHLANIFYILLLLYSMKQTKPSNWNIRFMSYHHQGFICKDSLYIECCQQVIKHHGKSLPVCYMLAVISS